MAFVKYSKAKLDLIGEETPDWVEDEDNKKEASKPSSESVDKPKDK